MTARAFLREAPRRLIVPNERAVEMAAADGEQAETRSSLVRRLLARLAPEVRFARGHEVRVALAQAMVMAAGSDPQLARLSAAGGATWLRTLDSLDRSIGKLRAAAVTPDMLARIGRSKSLAAGRARTLRIALEALDEQLERAGLVDARRAASVLIWAVEKTAPSAVRTAVGAPELLARGLLHWDPVDLSAWRALDAALGAAATGAERGGARVEMPSFALDPQAKISAQRERDPLEIVFEEIARALDDAPETAPLASPLGDLRLSVDPPAAAAERIELMHASDTDATARAAGDVVRRALETGASVDAVVIALTRSDAALAAALARTCDELAVVASFSPATGGGEEIEDAPGIVGVAMRALGCAERGLPSAELAELARSAYVDPRLLAPHANAGERRELSRVARAFDEMPRPAASTQLASLLGTVRSWHAARRERGELAGRTVGAEETAELTFDEEVVARLAGALLTGIDARTRMEHVAATRALFAALGFERRVRGALVRRFARADAADEGAVGRADLAARARDLRGWERLVAGVDGYEAALARLGIVHLPASRETFRHELAQVITELGQGEAAARAGTLRVLTLREVGDEPLDHLVVVDVAEGALPSATPDDPFFPETLEKDLGKGATRPTPPSVRRAVELGAFAVAAARARRTTLVHRAVDASGAALAPAPVFAWLARARPSIERWGSSPIAKNPRSAHEIALRFLHQAEPAARARFRPELARRARVEDEREGFFLDKARTRSAGVGDLTAVVASDAPSFGEALAAETGATRALGVSDLERWARCHFMGFSSTVLRVRERPRVRDHLEPREVGTVIHEALAAAFKATSSGWRERPRDREALFTRAMVAADEVLARQVDSGLREIALARARASIEQVVRVSLDDERWDFTLAEQPFGESAPGSWPPLVFRDADGSQVILRGRLDRLDLAHAGPDGELPARLLRVVDYKSSAGSQATSALGDTALQLPVYAIAALAALGEPSGADAARARAGAAYLGYSTRERGTSEKHDQALSARLDELLVVDGAGDGQPPIVRRALDLVSEGRRGDLVPTRDTAPCARCALDGICRKPRFVVPAASDEETATE